jgi:hypothetical protein
MLTLNAREAAILESTPNLPIHSEPTRLLLAQLHGTATAFTMSSDAITAPLHYLNMHG